MIRKHLPAKWLTILILAVTLPQDMMAQFNFDFETVEALIRDHKRIRSVLMVRDGIEHANEVLHQYSKKSVDKHYEINVDLDEFTRLFDVLDLMANSATTVINAVDTYSDVKKRINDYRSLIDEYNDVVTYIDLYKQTDNGIFRDIAHEEMTHAELIRNILTNAGQLGDCETAMENAQNALEEV